jgi:hypothetical protein
VFPLASEAELIQMNTWVCANIRRFSAAFPLPSSRGFSFFLFFALQAYPIEVSDDII